MGIARGQPAAMLHFDKIAEAALASGIGDGSVGHGIDGSAIAAAKIHSAVHALIAQDRMAAHAIAGGDPSVGWPGQFAIRLADA